MSASLYTLSKVLLILLCLLQGVDRAFAILVAVDEGFDSARCTTFWQNARAQGFEVDLRSYSDAVEVLRRQPSDVEHLVIFASSSKAVPAELSPQRLATLIGSGTSILLAVDPSAPESWRDFAREFEIDVDDKGSQAVDHFVYDRSLDDGSHTTLVVPLDNTHSPFVSESTRNGPPLVYRGALHSVGRHPLLQPVLSLPPTAYSARHGDGPADDLRAYGARAAVASAFQARNNARIVLLGSLEVFTDAALDAAVTTEHSAYPKSGNEAFLNDLVAWTFGLTGRRRIASVEHGRAGSSPGSLTYRVRDRIHYVVEVDSTEPGQINDLQLEFTMLDPHTRIPLRQVNESGSGRERFEASFVAPDRHGVFSLTVDHREPGYDKLSTKSVVSVTPPRHDEYDRFIRGAVPYYAGALSVSVGVIVFVVTWCVQS
ncbi:hypothetical protein JCM10212_001587 [Sporobolomyces blumeae]